MTDLPIDSGMSLDEREAAVAAREQRMAAREAAKRGPDRARAAKTARRRRALPVYITMATLFIGMFGFLSVRMAQGQDPAFAPKTAQVAAAPRRVIVRRVVVTRRITVIKPAAAAAPSGAGTAAVSAPASSGYSAPVQQTQAPVYTAPAPVYTAPAPAPAATKTS